MGSNGNGIRGGSGAGGAIKKDCWNACDYPSECRWGRRVGIHSPEALEFDCQQPPAPAPDPSTEMPNDTSSTILDMEQNQALFTTLLASAKRRKSTHPSSPLATPPNSTKDADGDIAMAAAPATAGSVAMDMLKDLMGRKASRREARGGPMLTLGKCVDLEMEGIGGGNEDVNGSGCGDVDMEFAPLERVGSRN